MVEYTSVAKGRGWGEVMMLVCIETGSRNVKSHGLLRTWVQQEQVNG